MINCKKCDKPVYKDIHGDDVLCLNCRIKENRQDDIRRESKYIVENGEGSSELGIICPYCGYCDEDFDYGEDCNAKTWTCYECEKEFDLEIDWTPRFYVKKRVIKK